MAIVHCLLTVGVEDWMGNRATNRQYFECDDADTLAQIISDFQAYCAVLNAITDGAGYDGRIEILTPPVGMKSTATVGNPLATGGLFTFSQDNIGNVFSSLVPALRQTEIVNGKINIASGTPAHDYLTLLTTGGTYLTYDSQVFNNLVAFLRCDINTRKHRRNQTKLSNEV